MFLFPTIPSFPDHCKRYSWNITSQMLPQVWMLELEFRIHAQIRILTDPKIAHIHNPPPFILSSLIFYLHHRTISIKILNLEKNHSFLSEVTLRVFSWDVPIYTQMFLTKFSIMLQMFSGIHWRFESAPLWCWWGATLQWAFEVLDWWSNSVQTWQAFWMANCRRTWGDFFLWLIFQ